MVKPLASNETRMARWDQMTPAERAKVSAREKAAAAAAEKERDRPLLSRIVDAGVRTFGTSAAAKARDEAAREDTEVREKRYQAAKKAASQSDKDRVGALYGVDRVLKAYRKGGSVSSASKRADGCATKGKTKGRFV